MNRSIGCAKCTAYVNCVAEEHWMKYNEQRIISNYPSLGEEI